MTYEEKRINGKTRVINKLKDKKANEKKERITKNKSFPIAIKNEMIEHNIYKGLSLKEKKLYRYILSIIKKDDDIDTTFILRHTTIQELLNEKGKELTSKVIYDMLEKISSSFHFENDNEILSIPVFKIIRTSKDKKTTEVVFNEWFNKFLFIGFDKGRFLKYELADIIDHKCLHSPELYEFILYRTRISKEEIPTILIKIDKLKKYLDCEKQENKDFIKQVIKKSINEMNTNINNRLQLGGNVAYTYNKTRKEITFCLENLIEMKKNKNNFI